MASWKDSVDDLWGATTAAELRDIAKQRVSEKKPLSELLQAAATGVKELKKAMTAFDARKKQQVDGVKKSPKKAGAATASSLWEKGLDLANVVPQFTSVVDIVDFSLPFVLKLDQQQHEILATVALLQ